jgi:hypothetical protein
MDSVLQEVAQEIGEKASVGIVTPEDRRLFQLFDVRSVPTLFIMRNGEVQRTYVGLVPKETLIKDLDGLGPGVAGIGS